MMLTESKTISLFKSTFCLLKEKKFFVLLIATLLFNIFVVFYCAYTLSNIILNFIIETFFLDFNDQGIFYYIYVIIKFFLTWILYSCIVIPFSSLLCGLIGDFIFDLLPNRSNLSLSKIKNSFTVSILFSLKAALSNVFLNILVLPVYFIFPGINYICFLLLNGYLFSRELSGCFMVQFENDARLKLFYREASGSLLLSGSILTFLISIPIVRYFVPFFAILYYANFVFTYLSNDN